MTKAELLDGLAELKDDEPVYIDLLQRDGQYLMLRPIKGVSWNVAENKIGIIIIDPDTWVKLGQKK